MQTIGLIVAYDGTPFSGWQRQEGSRTIQGELENALSRINAMPTQVRGASRTDAGVHAEWQVAAFETPRNYAPERWVQAINATTPPEIMVRRAFVAPDFFQPRFASRGKHYRYLVWQGNFVPPHLVHRAARTRVLNVENMRRAAASLLGEHDFSAFRAIDCQAKSPVRTLTRLDISVSRPHFEYPCEDGGALIQFDVEGTAFLKQMVRIMVGTLIEFGTGRPSEEMAEILESRARVRAGQTAPACGLTLMRSFCDDAFGSVGSE